MKNTIFWFITFAIIITVVGVTMIFTQDFVHEINENKIWVVTGLSVCHLHPWDKDLTRSMKRTDAILHYYEKQNIQIYDIRIYYEMSTSRLEETCFLGDRLYLLVGESDARYLLDFKFRLLFEGENIPKKID